MRICTKCKKEKSEDSFYFATYTRKKDGVRLKNATCKKCDTKKRMEYYTKNIEKEKIYRRFYHYRRAYGIEVKVYDILFEKQKGRCVLCGRNRKLYIDHDHRTGGIRGLLCLTCNVFLGWFENRETLIESYRNSPQIEAKINELRRDR